ncbi:MAG: lysostaphin resistance A-like protein [Bacillota bacterium]
MSVSPEIGPEKPEAAGVQDATPTLSTALDPFDAAKAWIFGLIATIVVGGALGGLSAYVTVAPMLAVSFFIVRKRRLGVRDVYRLKRPRAADLRFPLIFTVSHACTWMLVFEGVDHLTKGAISRAGQLLSGDAATDTLKAFIFAVTFVPIIEELFFRGFLLSSSEGMGRGWAVVLPSLFFAFAHDPLKWANTFISGVVWSVFIFETGSVATGVICHAVNNLVGMVLGLVGLVVGEFLGVGGDVAFLFLLAGGTALGLWHMREFKALWGRVRWYWADFRKDPGVVGGVRFLLKKWPYWVLLAMLVMTICLYVIVIVRGEPIQIG